MSRSTDVGVIVVRILDEVLDQCLDKMDEEIEQFLQQHLRAPSKYRSGYVPMAEAKAMIQKLGTTLRDLVYNMFSEAYPNITDNIKNRLNKTVQTLGELQQNVELMQKNIENKETQLKELKSENKVLMEHQKQLEDYINQLKKYYENIIQQLQQQLQALKDSDSLEEVTSKENIEQQIQILNDQWHKRYQELEQRYQQVTRERDELRQALQLKSLADKIASENEEK